MIVVEMDGGTVGRVRLSPSPLAEAVSLLQLLVTGRRDALFGDPGPAARATLLDEDVALLAAVMPDGGRGYLPDLLTPKPRRGQDVLADQLEAVRSTPERAVHDQLAVRFDGAAVPTVVSRAVGDGSFARRAARALALLWRAVDERWPQLAGAASADVARRAQLLGERGVAEVLSTLHPDLSYDHQLLQIRTRHWHELNRLVDTELVLSPAVLGWPHLSIQLCCSEQAVLRYPIGGGAMATSGRPNHALTALIGATRTTLLAELELPRSTTALSEGLHLAAGTVSYHLGILTDCGLVQRRRDRHVVLYQRTPRAELLLGGGRHGDEGSRPVGRSEIA